VTDIAAMEIAVSARLTRIAPVWSVELAVPEDNRPLTTESFIASSRHGL